MSFPGKLAAGFKKFFKALPWAKLKQKGARKWLLLVLIALLVLMLGLGFYMSREPGSFDVRQVALARAGGDESKLVTGYVTTSTLMKTMETLLYKPGGYLSNDITPPSIFLDNIPEWEFGTLVQIRDLAGTMRNHYSRSRTQSQENKYLKEAEPNFNFSNDSWLFTQGNYADGLANLNGYLGDLTRQSEEDAQFFARADNLSAWLAVVEKRLGDLSQRLGASVAQVRVNTDLAGETGAAQSTQVSRTVTTKTSWMQIDNNFYEARGACWALLHYLRAVQIDFASVLAKKNADNLVEQIIRELEGTQRQIWSPVILNGSGFGLWANHSLVMASYISRANASVIDLRDLLSNG